MLTDSFFKMMAKPLTIGWHAFSFATMLASPDSHPFDSATSDPIPSCVCVAYLGLRTYSIQHLVQPMANATTGFFDEDNGRCNRHALKF